MALVAKWMSGEFGTGGEEEDCVGCGKRMLKKSLKGHVRKDKGCYEKFVEKMKKNWQDQ